MENTNTITITITERDIPSYIRALTARLAARGKRGYPVGGCIRDLLMGRTPNDFDMTADATPAEMLDIFSDLRVIPTGLAHGTVTVLSDGHAVEITTHRADGTYSDGRHPDAVSFSTSLEEDLKRRDFTVNAMAYSTERGVIDVFGGREDIATRTLRAVGDPVRRFSEDALRILRCFRFAAQLDFEIDPATAAGAEEMRQGLRNVSPERITAELTKLLTASAAHKGLAAMAAAKCLPYVFLDLEPDMAAAERLPLLPADPALRLAALLHRYDEATLREFCRARRTSNAVADALCGTLRAYRAAYPDTPFAARRFVCRHFGFTEGGLALAAALDGKDVTDALALSRRVLKDGTAVELRRLAVNGRELQERAGIPPRETGTVLARLQELVWEDPSRNRKELLLEAARRLYTSTDT